MALIIIRAIFMYEFFIQYAGFCGVTIVLVAHFFFAFDFLSNSSVEIKVYTIISILGSSLFLFSSLIEKDAIFITLNLFSVLIGVLGFFNIRVNFPFSVKFVLFFFLTCSLSVFFFNQSDKNFLIGLLESFAFTSSFLIIFNFFMYLNGVLNKVANILIYMLTEVILLTYALIADYGVAIYSQVGFLLISIFSLLYLYVRHAKKHGSTSIYRMALDLMYFR